MGRVGLYGLTYKENVDDTRESPTLQMLESMERHLCGGQIKVYDPYVTRDLVPNQYHDLDSFLHDVDMVVLLVGHDEIKEHMDELKGKNRAGHQTYLFPGWGIQTVGEVGKV